MARSESQGLQIGLIVSLMFLLLFVGTTYWFFRQYSEASEMAKRDKEEAAKLNASLRDVTTELQELKKKTGFAETLASADWKKSSEEDMKLYAPTLTADQQSYREALKQQANALRESNTNLAATIADLQAQQAINEQRETVKQKQIDEYKNKHDELAKVYVEERTKITSDRDRLEKEKADQLAATQKAADDFDKQREAQTRQISQLEGQVGLIKNQLGQQQETISELLGNTQALPDGTIRRVNQRGTVWIDVGEMDHLPRQLAFSVYGVDQNGVARDKRKGAIEVTQIIGPHLAEAKIVEDDILNPIVPGDQIYTPLWQPGRQEHFALAGFVDLDGDDLSDRHVLRDMITMSGGVLDAELDDEGKFQGQMTIDTRYLILGPKREDAAEAKIGEVEAKARDLGIEVITLAHFLERSGWKDTKRVMRYDGSKPGNFTGPTRDGGVKVSRGVNSGAFKKRTPRKQLNSAYDNRQPLPESAVPTAPTPRATGPKVITPGGAAADADADADAGADEELMDDADAAMDDAPPEEDPFDAP